MKEKMDIRRKGRERKKCEDIKRKGKSEKRGYKERERE